MNQPFALFVKSIFEKQDFPDLTKYPALWQGLVRPQEFPDSYLPPYDMAGWTLPMQMGVNVAAAGEPLTVSLARLEEVEAPAGSVAGRPRYAYLLSPKVNNSFIAVNRILEAGGDVLRARESFRIGEESYAAGTWIVPSGSVGRSLMETLAEDLHLTMGSADSRPSVETIGVTAPRIALYQSWVANIDEGWTRWLFEQFEIPFTNVHDADVKAGNLSERYDCIVIPSQSPDSIVQGHEEGTMPPTYVGGMTVGGVENVKNFVEGGGTLVLQNAACGLVIDEAGLPVSDGLKDVRPPRRRSASGPARFACPGSLLRMKFNSDHPVAYGMPDEAPGVFSRSPAFAVHPTFGERGPVVIAGYPEEKILMSGYLKGEEYLRNKASVVSVPLGRGRVILLGFGVQARAQPHGTFKLLFNSLYYASSN